MLGDTRPAMVSVVAPLAGPANSAIEAAVSYAWQMIDGRKVHVFPSGRSSVGMNLVDFDLSALHNCSVHLLM